MTTLNFGVIIISNASVCSTSGSNNVCQRQRRLLPKDSFIHSGYVYCASSSRPTLLFRGALDYSIDIVLELTCRSATDNCEWRTCQRSLSGGWSGTQTCYLPDARHRTYLWATTPYIDVLKTLDDYNW